MSRSIPSFLFIIFFQILVPCALLAQGFSKYVDPLIGTGGHGHTFPGATTPFGMVQLSPDTRFEGWDACGGYHYSDPVILGFSHLHLSGTGIPDYGDILFTPTLKRPDFTPEPDGKPSYRHRSNFSHDNEIAVPGYYGVLLDDDSIRVELTATPRCGLHRYLFPRSDSAAIIVDLLHGLGPDRVLESEILITADDEISGYRRSSGWAKDQRIYFVAQFSKPFQSFAVVRNDTLFPGSRADTAVNLRAVVTYRTGMVDEVMVRVGLSTVSADGARKNLAAEIPDWDFEKVRSTAALIWERELSRIVVEGGTDREKTKFYTALYHTMIAPNISNDVDGSYRGMDMEIRNEKSFTMYSVFSLWDTFRAEHPLLTLIDPARTLDFIKSMLQKYREGGVLPVWELASNETWTMIGYHSVPVITDAWAKGIRGFDSTLALEAMKASSGLNRFGLESYRTYGYIPGDLESESVSKTLEYAYDDWCISRFAEMTGQHDVAAKYDERAQYYQNLFDPVRGFARPRINGGWAEPFDPRAVTFHYTEANPWQYTFFAPHDIDGLIDLYGGQEKFVEKLDSLFFTSSATTGREQADITGMIGQYAQGNEPSHHVAYLYPYAGQPWKTQQIVRTIMDSLYTDRPDGLCGNDDCGQMSAWYVFSALGFYPVTPGSPLYTIGSPSFPRVRINLPNRRSFTVEAANASGSNRFVQTVSLNGRPLESLSIRHDVLTSGGELKFTMGATADTHLPGINTGYTEYSPQGRITSVPVFTHSRKSFTDSTVVEITDATPGASIFFSTDGSVPNFSSPEYAGPLTLVGSTTIHAIATAPGRLPSRLLYGEFSRFDPPGSIELSNPYSDQYTGGGNDALIDGLSGGTDFRLGAWQGYEGTDLEAVLELKDESTIADVTLGVLQDNNSWIFFPTEMEVSLSTDGMNYSMPVTVSNDVSPREEDARRMELAAHFDSVPARYIKIRARNLGVCPEWHKGAGGKAWLFVDEITIRNR